MPATEVPNIAESGNEMYIHDDCENVIEKQPKERGHCSVALFWV